MFVWKGFELLLCHRSDLSTSPGRIGVGAEDIEERSGGGGEVGAAAVSGPESAIVTEATDRDCYQDSALQLFTHTHARHERQTYTLLHETLNRLDRCQLE